MNNNNGNEKEADKMMRELLEMFLTPDVEYLPSLMWFWNDRITEDEISFQIKKFHESGIREFYVMGLWGMEGDYLTTEFFELIKYTVAEAKAHGMQFWFYDEYNWPSGNAGGYLLRDEPWTRNKVLKSMKVDLFAAQPLNVCIRGEFVAAQIIFGNKVPFVEDVTEYVEIRREGETSYLFYANQSCASSAIWLYYTDDTRGMTAAGMWASFSWFQEGYMDTNNPAAVRKFIEYTHEKYKEAIGEEFGKTVKGLFTDEVNNMSMFDNVKGVTPWTGLLPVEFASEHGYSLLPKLYALHCSFVNDEVLKVRYDYWRTCTRLFRDAYMQQVADWCKDNNLILTGHPSGENTLYWHAFQSGDFYEVVTPFHIPGIDSILSKLLIDDPGFSVDAKLVSSAAKYNRQSRIMCETFSGSGWDMKLAEAKRIINRLMVHGINMIVYMGAYYSLNGARKKLPLGYPPSHSYNNPLFAHYDVLNKHTARISYLSAITRPAGKVMVMIPQVTQYIQPYESAKHDFAWHTAAKTLMGLHIEFDFGFECLAGEMQVHGSRLVLREDEYDVIIVPGMAYTTSQMSEVLSEFIKQGGRVIFVNALPERAVDTGEHLDFAGLCGISNERVETALKQIVNDLPSVCLHLDGSRGSMIATNEQPDTAVRSLISIFTSLLAQNEGSFRIDAAIEGIFTGYRRNDDMELLFIANDKAETVQVNGSLPSEGKVMLLDPGTGESRTLGVQTVENRRRFSLELPGYHMVAVIVTHEEAEFVESVSEAESEQCVLAPNSNWTFAAEGGNWLPLRIRIVKDMEKLLALAKSGKAMEVFAAIEAMGGSIAIESACGELPGGCGVDLGAEYAAVARFHVNDIPEILELIVELEDEMVVYLNGTRLSGFESIRLWGIRDASLNIAGHIRLGENTLFVTAKVPSWSAPHSIPSILLRGQFKLSSNDVLIAPDQQLKPECWTKQGFPYFSGNGTYRTTFDLEEFRKVCICVPTTDIVTVSVNGRVAAVLPWAPYEADITDCCVRGMNEISLTFTSCYANLMDIEKVTLLEQGVTVYEEQGASVDSGLLAIPQIVIYR